MANIHSMANFTRLNWSHDILLLDTPLSQSEGLYRCVLYFACTQTDNPLYLLPEVFVDFACRKCSWLNPTGKKGSSHLSFNLVCPCTWEIVGGFLYATLNLNCMARVQGSYIKMNFLNDSWYPDTKWDFCGIWTEKIREKTKS